MKYAKQRPAVRLALTLALALALVITGCGYRLAGRRLNNGEGKTIAIPTFRNTSASPRIEQRMTEAARREIIQRTRFKVTSEAAGDLLISGEVRVVGLVPILFDEQGRASSYSIAVDLDVKITDSVSGQMIYQNSQWTFHDTFEMARTSRDFVLEDSPALDRIAKNFASSLVATLLHAAP